MDQARLFQLSRRAAQDLLEGLEDGWPERVAVQTAAIRQCMALAERAPADGLRGEALYQREQMEVLAGLAERLESGPDRLGVSRRLLRHLVGPGNTGILACPGAGAGTLKLNSTSPAH